MTPEEILSHPPRILTQAQREHYFTHGYVGVESLVPADILAELVGVTNEFVEASRSETVSGRMFDIGPGHSKESVVLRRLKSPDDRHEAYWRIDDRLRAGTRHRRSRFGSPRFQSRQASRKRTPRPSSLEVSSAMTRPTPPFNGSRGLARRDSGDGSRHRHREPK